MIKVMTVIGTRPEAIKLAPVLRELDRRPESFQSQVLVTGQHREMLDPMLDLFEIEPDYDLAVMQPQQSLTDLTSAVLRRVEPVLRDERPDWVVVQGDTTTVMATSMAAFYQKVNVAHVEAGLRTFDKYSPFPEELNRRIAGVVADLHFAPTPWAASNLLREGVPGHHVYVTGNTVIDSLQDVSTRDFDPVGSGLEHLPVGTKRIVLVTAHRSENFGDGMEEIARALRTLALRHPDVHLVYPVHLNPKAREPAYAQLSDLDNVSLLQPLDYQPLVWLLARAHLVITDSGGLQEEAAGVGKPVLVLRETTERPEGVEAGIAKLIGARYETIVSSASRLLRSSREYEAMARMPNPYGDGRAAHRIADALFGEATVPAKAEHTYEQPQPEHPLDALLRHATADLPKHYADQVMARAKRRERRRFTRPGRSSPAPTHNR